MATRTLEIVLAGDHSSASRSFRKIDQDAKKMGDRLDREGTRVRGFASVSSGGLKRVGVAAAGMGAAVAGGAALLAKSFVTSATAIEESLSKNEVLFGKQADTIDRFSKRTAANFGISRQAALEATGTFGNLFVALEIGPKRAADMSIAMTKLAADMASFNNASPEEALEAIRSGLVGETEPLRRFGVNLNDATLRAQALKMGLIDTVKNALTPQQRALAVNSLLFKQTEKAQGDFARTSGGLANQTRILKARLADIGAELGARLLPHARRAATAVNNMITEWRRGHGPLAAAERAIKDVVAAIRSGVSWFGRHRTATTVLMSVVAGLTAAFVAYRIAVVAAAVATRGLAIATTLLNVAMRANPIGLVVTALIALGAGLVVAYKRSETFRKIVNAGFDHVKRQAQVAAAIFNKVLLPAFRAVVKGAEAIWSAMKKVAGVFGGVGNAVKGAAGALNPFGDGLGKTAQDMASIPRFGGGLMGARPELGPIAGIGQRFGLRVSSGLRPGATTSSGRPSWHGTGEALDLAGQPSGMMGFARFMSKRAGSLAELIYTPLGAWSNGSRYTPTGKLAADHYDHVHVAMDVGAPGQGDGLGKFESTAYGPPWNAMNGTGVTATGVDLRPAKKAFGIAVDPSRLKLGKNYYVWPNPFGRKGPFKAFDTGGAIKGNRIDFYDWRGRAAQLGWGRKPVTISDDPGLNTSSGGPAGVGGKAGPTGGGGSGTAGGGSGNLAFGTGNAGGSPGQGGATSFALGYEGKIAKAQLGQARAQARDDLSGMIKELSAERAIKRKRLRLIYRVLKGRLKPARRTRLIQEATQLEEEIGTLTATIKEYKADRAGGATTITRAEELEAGVDTSAGAGGGADTGGGGVSGPDNSALIAVMAEVAANQRKLIHLAEVQGPQLVGAVVAAVNGSIGGSLGLGGLQAAGVPGQLARY